MTLVHLVCPSCKHQDVYEENNLDTSTAIDCPACGFSGLPTSFELPKGSDKTSWDLGKIVIIVLAGIAFVFAWLWVITLAAFYAPVIVAAAVIILTYRRWREKRGKRTNAPSPPKRQ